MIPVAMREPSLPDGTRRDPGAHAADRPRRRSRRAAARRAARASRARATSSRSPRRRSRSRKAASSARRRSGRRGSRASLARRAGALATVNQPESLQLVIDESARGASSARRSLHVAGRAVGRRGVFYELLGEAIAAIDGYTGTLPPYERAIVLGPAEPDRVSAELAAALGLHVAIVDANDLRRAKALGASPRRRARGRRARAARQSRTATATSKRRSSSSRGAARAASAGARRMTALVVGVRRHVRAGRGARRRR